MLKINHKYALITSIYILISLILYFSLNFTIGKSYSSIISMMGLFVIFQLIFTFSAYIMMDIEALSLSGSFTWLNYLFHFGQVILKSLVPSYVFSFDVSMYVSQSAYIESLNFSYLMVIMVSSGILVLKTFQEEKPSPKYKFSELISRDVFKIGTFIFALTFPIELYIQITRIIVARTSGYLSTFDVEVSGFVGFLATFSLVGVIMMILGSKEDQKKGTTIMMLYTFFYIITMFSGGRMWQVIKILLVFYYYIKTFNIKIRGKNSVVLLIISYLGAGFMSAVADFRAYDVQGNDYILNVFREVFINNPLLQVLEEFGSSLYTLTLTIEKTPFQVPFSHGIQFITNFVSLLPNLNDTITKINDGSNYVLLLQMPTIGGSFIGEMYYSFNNLAFIVAFFIGVLLQIITNKIERGIKENDYHFIIYSLMLQYSFISWVRGSSQIFYRNSIYGIIIIYAISYMIIKKSTRETHQIKKRDLRTSIRRERWTN